MYCRYCGHHINQDDQYCPYCGRLLKNDPYVHDTYIPKRSHWTIGQIIILLGTFLLFISLFLPYLTISNYFNAQTYFFFDTAYGIPFLIITIILVIFMVIKQPKLILLTSMIATLLDLYALLKYTQTTTYYVYAIQDMAFYLIPIACLLLLSGSILNCLNNA